MFTRMKKIATMIFYFFCSPTQRPTYTQIEGNLLRCQYLNYTSTNLIKMLRRCTEEMLLKFAKSTCLNSSITFLSRTDRWLHGRYYQQLLLLQFKTVCWVRQNSQAFSVKMLRPSLELVQLDKILNLFFNLIYTILNQPPTRTPLRKLVWSQTSFVKTSLVLAWFQPPWFEVQVLVIPTPSWKRISD